MMCELLLYTDIYFAQEISMRGRRIPLTAADTSHFNNREKRGEPRRSSGRSGVVGWGCGELGVRPLRSE